MAFAGPAPLMMDGKPVRSCITLTAAADETEFRTVEGYEGDDLMQAIRKAFNQRHALQCGFCTPGMLATAYDMLSRIPDLDRDRIRAELAGNLCRCTGYLPIIQAIQDVHALRRVPKSLRPEPQLGENIMTRRKSTDAGFSPPAQAR